MHKGAISIKHSTISSMEIPCFGSLIRYTLTNNLQMKYPMIPIPQEKEYQHVYPILWSAKFEFRLWVKTKTHPSKCLNYTNIIHC